MTDMIALRALRPVMVYGRRVERGARVELPPLEALAAVEGSPALAFVDPDDRQRCVEARLQQRAREARNLPHAAAGDPWRPAGRF